MANKTQRADSASVLIDTSTNDFLVHRVIFKGATAAFAIDDIRAPQRLLSSVSGSGSKFERKWPLPADTVVPSTRHVAHFSYAAGATLYTYQLEVVRNGKKFVVVDIDYADTA